MKEENEGGGKVKLLLFIIQLEIFEFLSGLYMTLRSYDLPYPEAVFEVRFAKPNTEKKSIFNL